ncbi:MAG: hypothetical protein AAF674_19785, partial [Pseudomonadota bacterium]
VKAQLAVHSKALGAEVTPDMAMDRLLQLNTYATTKPSEYLAWFTQQTGGANPLGLLQDAAKHLGLTLTPAAEQKGGQADDAANDDDDLFKSPGQIAAEEKLKQANARIAQLEGGSNPATANAQGQAQPTFGPDTQAERDAASFRNVLSVMQTQLTELGAPAYPLFDALRPNMTVKAQNHMSQKGTWPTLEDMTRFYDEVQTELGLKPAAQPSPPPVNEQADSAAAATKAQRASKSIDGSGQGAPRRPALDRNASLDEVIRYNMDLSAAGEL